MIRPTTLTSDHVTTIFMDCLFKEGEDQSGAVIAEGILVTAGFHPGRLEEYRSDVRDMISELPTEFHSSGGGGWSFLNACMTKTGEQWTGLHQVMDQLFMLAMALGLAKCQLPRDMWAVLPGGMPYYSVEV